MGTGASTVHFYFRPSLFCRAEIRTKIILDVEGPNFWDENFSRWLLDQFDHSESPGALRIGLR